MQNKKTPQFDAETIIEFMVDFLIEQGLYDEFITDTATVNGCREEEVEYSVQMAMD